MPLFNFKIKEAGDDLLFRTPTHAVSLALMGLTTLFGMGRGVSPSQ